MSWLPRLANELWAFSNLERHRRFVRALDRPGKVQENVLRSILRRNASCELGRRHGFATIDSVAAFQSRVPLTSYGDLAADIERIHSGEEGVRTSARVERLIPSSGSTSARKLLPCTRSLLAEFQRAIGPWIVDLLARADLRKGRAYWSISPAIEPEHDGRIPIGFADDGEYLGRWTRFLVEHALAVPSGVERIQEIEAFRYTVLLHLLRARDLALVSVWHPSYFTLLLQALTHHWERLVQDVRRGSYRPPAEVPALVSKAMVRGLRPLPRRADELDALGPRAIVELWPELQLVSCWGDGPARGALEELRALLPGVEIQPKGLVATEAFVSLPFRGAHPLAVRSHFFEFVDAEGRALLVEDLRAGGEYTVVVTTGGGLARYLLGDRVRVTGFVGRTPSLTFLGKDDGVVDQCGEKLSDGFVAGRLQGLFTAQGVQVPFAMVAPSRLGTKPAYVLYVESARELPPRLASDLEALLEENPHYRWCITLGQLAPLRVFRIRGGAHAAYCERLRTLGRKLGDVKPVSLSALPDWEQWFHGVWVEGVPAPLRSAR